jgi:triacylglycerol lipase
MLAKLLRRLLLTQALIGAALGAWIGQEMQWPWLPAAVFALLLPFATMVVVDIASGLMSRAPGEPLGHWLRSLWGEFHAGFLIFLFRQPWARQEPTLLPATGPEAKIPVVLVHGYLCNHRIWDDVTRMLRAQGHTVYAVNLEPVFGSIDQYAPVLENAVQALLQHTGQSQVALVGHSMGGLAIRAWMRAHGTERVARVITLGTPHAGTRLAKGSPAKNAKQMQWASAWLQELGANETDALRQRFRIALTPQDNIVCPQRAQVLPGITPVVFEGIGHLQMCIDPTVLQWLKQELASIQAEKVAINT